FSRDWSSDVCSSDLYKRRCSAATPPSTWATAPRSPPTPNASSRPPTGDRLPAARPVGVADLAEDRAVGRHQGAFAQAGAEVAGVRGGDDLAGVVPGREGVAEALVHP